MCIVGLTKLVNRPIWLRIRVPTAGKDETNMEYSKQEECRYIELE